MKKKIEVVSEPWLSDQKDPDNYFKIPEFGVFPADVAFEGFGPAICSPSFGLLRERHENIRALVKFARARIRTQFKSLCDVRAASLRVLDALFPPDGSSGTADAIGSLRSQDKSAFFYEAVMQALSSAASDEIYPGLPKDPDNAAQRLSMCAVYLSQWLTNDFDGAIQHMKNAASQRGKLAADALHSKPGGNREKQEQMRQAWASGKFSSRDVCAEQEAAAMGMSLSSARKALRGTPEPG